MKKSTTKKLTRFFDLFFTVAMVGFFLLNLWQVQSFIDTNSARAATYGTLAIINLLLLSWMRENNRESRRIDQEYSHQEYSQGVTLNQIEGEGKIWL